jgi:PHD/YefM family antitoxin component YafN of YafNO toxin-antitoxin module
MLKILPEAILAEDLEVELLRNKKAMSETEYLLSTKANAENLAKSIKQAEDGADLIQFDPTKD